MGQRTSKAVVALAFLAQGLVSTAVLAEQAAQTKVPRASAPGGARSARDASVARLKDQLQRLCALSPLTLEGATAVLGVRLENGSKSSPVNTEWQMTSTEVLAGGRAGVSAGAVYVEIRPALSLRFNYEDLAVMLLDAPYDMNHIWAHGPEDGGGTEIATTYHIFRVKAGEVRLEIPFLGVDGRKPHRRSAIDDAYDAAYGKMQPPTLLHKILITSEVRSSRGQADVRTLRSMRSLVNRRKPGTKTPPVR